MEKGSEKRKAGKNNANKPLRKKAKRDHSPKELGKGNESAQKSAGKGDEKKKSSKQNTAKNGSSRDEEREKSPEKPGDKEKFLQKSPTKLENKEKGRRQKKQKRRSIRRRHSLLGDHRGCDVYQSLQYRKTTYLWWKFLTVRMQKKKIQCKKTRRSIMIRTTEREKETTIPENIKAPPKRNKPSVIKGSSKKMFNAMLVLLWICILLKVDLKEIPGKFSKWLAKIFDPYAVCFGLLDGQQFLVIAFDVYVTPGVPFRGREIIKSTKTSMNEEYDEVHATWLKEWKIDQNAPKLTQMPDFILAKKDGVKALR
ncbi:hypothetical protein Cgig2_020565 [Carnegiea gigantea]|uniref:Uncharacterized protein n=1 Tax=Carnegiea gigantea TaxID=171969 RepID=A0A9Q1GW51_9CARY|nr:hypothetical protein Cgig2_020565 [Carnegiea gigantea]